MTASAAERISVGATPGSGMSLSGPSAGGTTFRLDLPEFTQTWVRAGDPQGTTFGLWPNGSIHYWADGMSGPEQLVTPAGVRFTQIAANGSSRAPTGYALSTTGTAYAWGYGLGGQLGNGAAESSDELVPVSLPGGVQATSIGANGNGGFALGDDGDLYMWGYIPTTSPPVFGRSTATPERIPNPSDVSFTRLYVANDQWVYAWDAQGALYQWNGRVEPSIVRAPTGQSVTPPAAEESTPEVTDVWFGSPYTSSDQTVTKSGSSWLVTTPDFRGKCGPIDVIVWYTFGGVSLEDTGSFTINTPCAPTAVSAVAGDGRATVSFSAPPGNGGSVPVTGYAVTATPTAGPGNPVTARGASSPITVTGLANGTTYDIKVIASNVNGDGGWSDQFGYQGSRTVTPQGSLAITGVPSSVTYGDAGFTLGTSGGSGSGAVTYSVQSGAEVLSVDSTTGAVTIRGAGTATVVATKAADGTVAAATASVSITVARLPITVTADDKTMPARGAAPPRTYTINPPLVGDDTLNIAAFWAHSGGVVGVDATYTSELVQPITHPNYSVTFVPGTLTEVPALQEQAALSITGAPSSVTYGDAGFTLGTSGGSGSGAVTYSVPAGNGVLAVGSTTGSVTVVGAGTVSVTATKAGGGSHQAISTTRSVTVARRAVTVTAEDRTKVFGAADPALTFSVSPALVAGDTLTGSLTYTGSDVGAYAIVQGTVFADPNYTVTFVPGTMTITPAVQAALSITGAPSSVTYGDAGFTLGTSGGSGSGAVTYSVPAGNGVLAVDSTTGSVTVVGAGTVSVTATKAGGGSYQAISTTRSVTVARRAVTVTAQDRTKVFGAADPALTFSVSPALVAGDTLTGSLTYTGSDVGAYAIVQGTAFADPNYTVTFVPGTMTITQTAAAQAAIDDVQALPPTVSSTADADLVAEATNATAALSPAEQAQIPTEVLDALHEAQDLAGAYNHADSTHGVTASGDTLPWNVRLVVSAGSVEEGEDFVSQLPGRDLLALYDLSFVDTLTGEAWEPEDGEPVTIQLSQVDVAGRGWHRRRTRARRRIAGDAAGHGRR